MGRMLEEFAEEWPRFTGSASSMGGRGTEAGQQGETGTDTCSWRPCSASCVVSPLRFPLKLTSFTLFANDYIPRQPHRLPTDCLARPFCLHQ